MKEGRYCTINDEVHNIIKFNFPNINLLDSAHHNQCDGMVIFNIKPVNGKMDDGAYNSLSISNTVGQLIMQKGIAAAQTTINIKSLPAGMYYIMLRGDNGTVVRKFVKE